LFLQFPRHDAAERIQKFLVGGNFFLPFLVVDAEDFCYAFVI
jgi:hypothetical protein